LENLIESLENAGQTGYGVSRRVGEQIPTKSAKLLDHRRVSGAALPIFTKSAVLNQGYVRLHSGVEETNFILRQSFRKGPKKHLDSFLFEQLFLCRERKSLGTCNNS
jgi:hypothetical protein